MVRVANSTHYARLLLGLQITAKKVLQLNKPLPWYYGVDMLFSWGRYLKPMAEQIAGKYLEERTARRTLYMYPEGAKKFLEDFPKLFRKYTGYQAKIIVEYDPVEADILPFLAGKVFAEADDVKIEAAPSLKKEEEGE